MRVREALTAIALGGGSQGGGSEETVVLWGDGVTPAGERTAPIVIDISAHLEGKTMKEAFRAIRIKSKTGERYFTNDYSTDIIGTLRFTGTGGNAWMTGSAANLQVGAAIISETQAFSYVVALLPDTDEIKIVARNATQAAYIDCVQIVGVK